VPARHRAKVVVSRRFVQQRVMPTAMEPRAVLARGAGAVMDRLIRITTALAVMAVAVVAAVISYQHAYELVSCSGC
jgi:hypothetical protein